ncbi:MAG: EamA family transporter [Rhodospirillaceae bacterium]|nr:EamA family transporter [Rhodospirillaceae bacterium]
MEWSVIFLVLLAAVMHASWNTMVKVQVDRFTMLAVLALACGVLSLLALPFVDAPAPASWPIIGLSVVLHVGYNLFLVEAYRHGDLSQAYPIARGTTPILVLLLAAVFASEAITPMSALGVAVVSIGIISLSFSRRSAANTTSVLWALGTSVWIAGYSVADGIGARLAGTPHGFIVWLNLLWALPLIAIGFWRQGPHFLGAMRAVWKPAFASGAVAMSGYWIVVWAMASAPLAAVSALRETSVIVAALIGTIFLKEPFGLWRVAAATLVAGGVAIMRVGD